MVMAAERPTATPPPAMLSRKAFAVVSLSVLTVISVSVLPAPFEILTPWPMKVSMSIRLIASASPALTDTAPPATARAAAVASVSESVRTVILPTPEIAASPRMAASFLPVEETTANDAPTPTRPPAMVPVTASVSG